MKNESNGQHLVFIIMLACILFLSYCSIPSHGTGENMQKTSKRLYAKAKVQAPEVQAPEVEAPEVEAPAVEAPEAKIESPTAEEPTAETAVKSGNQTVQPDVIPMNNALYKTHKKGIVQFTHQQHVEKYLIACGDCHHDETGKPLDLNLNETPKGCIECHKGTEKPKDEKLGKKEKIAQYHFEALHANCIDCHKAYNIKKGDAKGKGPAPTSCTNCHPKKA